MPRVTNKQDLLMSTLTMFYKNTENLGKFLPIIRGKSRISLRLIDWFVTNYSKKENVIFPVELTPGKITQFIVHTNYKSQLKAYSKRYFDPFCRGDNIRFCYDEKLSKSILSTVGQLNFFRWIISNGILEYIENNVTDIERDMTQSMKTGEDISQKVNVSRKKKTDAVSKEESFPEGKKEISSAVNCNSTIDVRKSKSHRKQLSVSATRTVLKHDVAMIVSFP